MDAGLATAPPLQVSQWFNTAEPITLDGLRGRVVVLHTFQMLCPGCIAHGIPQALRVHELFAPSLVTVLGLHTVFEHHDVMGPQALRVFLHEYRVRFPVGVDQADGLDPVPLTMRAYALQGTPSVVVIDKLGRQRLNHFGAIDDLHLGTVIGQLLAEPAALDGARSVASHAADGTAADCSGGACAVDAAETARPLGGG
jgi:hypothetical protein